MAKERIPTDGASGSLGQNPFSGLMGGGLPAGPSPVAKVGAQPVAEKVRKKGRVDVRREKAGRGGKTVLTVSGEGFLHSCPAELEALLKRLKATCGTGGTLKDKTLEIQGDHREALLKALEEAGYRPVWCGG